MIATINYNALDLRDLIAADINQRMGLSLTGVDFDDLDIDFDEDNTVLGAFVQFDFPLTHRVEGKTDPLTSKTSSLTVSIGDQNE